MTHKFIYYCYGYRIISSISIPELARTSRDIAQECASGNFDLSIDMITTSVGRHPGIAVGYSVRDAHTILFHLPALATFIIRDGQAIMILRYPGASLKHIRLYLLGSVIGAAAHQRTLLPLHASAVTTAYGVVAFSGARGFGKSTMAAALRSRGFDVVTDDLLMLEPKADGRIAAFRGAPFLKVLPDAADKFKTHMASGQIDRKTGKYHLPTGVLIDVAELELKRVYFLHFNELRDREVRIREITQTESVLLVVGNVYRPELIYFLGSQKRILEQSAAITRRVECFSIERPRNTMEEVDKFVDIVERHITVEKANSGALGRPGHEGAPET